MNYAIMLAGGPSRRAFTDKGQKQFVRAGGRMMVTHALEPLLCSKNVDKVCVVAEHEWRDIILLDVKDAGLDVDKISCFAIPANTNRQGSILNALQEILRDICGEVNVEKASDSDTVLIHDAARPFLTTELLDKCYEEFDCHDGIMSVILMTDNIYRTKTDGFYIEIDPVDREGMVIEQTPEIFKLKKYYKANMALMPDKLHKIKAAAEPALMAGMEVITFDGDDRNLKVTTKADMEKYLLLKSKDRL